MDIKEHLRSVRKLYLEIEAKRRQRDRLYYAVTGSNIKLREVDVQTSISGDKLGDTMAEAADLDRAIREDIRTLCKRQYDTARLFKRLSKPEYIAIMTDYYLNAYTWEKVAEINGYSLKHAEKLHGIALNELRSKDDTK